MKIQFFGNSSFGVIGKSAKVAMNPAGDSIGKVDIATSSKSSDMEIEAKKKLTLPGEYEVSGVLARGLHTNDRTNVVFKIVMDEIEVAHFGEIASMPLPRFFSELGENVDVALFNLSEKSDLKMVKEFLEKVDPRIVIFGGDKTMFPKAVEKLNAVIKPEPELIVSRSSLPSENTEFVILSV